MKHMLIAVLALGVLTMAISQITSADAACRGDCTPPTLGLTDNARRVVEGGFAINDVPFDVESYSQTIPTQVFAVGDKVTIKLTGYENSGIGNLRHVSLTLSDPTKQQGYQDMAKIMIERSFEGIVTRNVADNAGLLKNVNIKSQRIDSFTGSMDISFVAAKPFDTSSITVQMWDAGASVSKNIFEDAIQVVGMKPQVSEQGTTDDTTPSAEKAVNPKESKVKKKMDDQQKLKDEKVKKALESKKKPYISEGKKKNQLPKQN